MSNHSPSMALSATITALLLFAVGAALTFGGWQLAALGGSLYYLASGAALLIGGLWVWRGNPASYWLICLFAGTTLVWAITESGLHLWALLPRVAVPMALLGLFLIPAVRAHVGVAGRARLATPALLSVAGLVLVGATLNAQFKPVDGNQRVLAERTDAPAWTHYGASASGNSYSSAEQINRDNVATLERAWTFNTDEDTATSNTFQTTPIEIDGDLIFCSPSNRVFSLDGDTGEQNWAYDPKVERDKVPFFVCRGLAHHRTLDPSATLDSAANNPAVCASRVLMGTVDNRLLALDASTGKPCPGFADDGEINLSQGLGEVMRGHHYISSPPAVIGDIAVVGSFILDNQSTRQPPGVVRAYNVHSGELVWAWDVLQATAHPPLKDGQSYPRNTANVWSLMSVDEDLGLIYLPTGNVPPDFFGGFRSPEQDRYPSSVVALEAATGDVRWSFQTVHHDIWDYDVGAQPVLLDFPLDDGSTAPAVIVATKWGDVFVLDRRTGEPLTEVVEKPVPQNPAEGEWLSPTQPFSVGFPSFAPQDLNEQQMWGSTLFDQLWCRIAFKKRRYDGLFTPQSLQGIIQNPGNFGAVDWGSVSIDPQRQLMLVNSTGMPFEQILHTREDADRLGFKLWGNDDSTTANAGTDETASANANAAQDHDYTDRFAASDSVSGAAWPLAGTPYGVTSNPFLSPLGFPCHQPPWGELTAVDLATRKVLWQRPLGTTDGHAPLGLAFPTGVFNIGGTAVTRGGLTFVAGTIDNYLRAFDSETGEELWRGALPAGGQAGPMSFVSPTSGDQFVVIAAGGHVSMRTDQGDALVAFRLPRP